MLSYYLVIGYRAARPHTPTHLKNQNTVTPIMATAIRCHNSKLYLLRKADQASALLFPEISSSVRCGS